VGVTGSKEFGSSGAVALLEEIERDDDAPSAPALEHESAGKVDRPSQRGRRDVTPTFSGSSAELVPLRTAHGRARLIAAGGLLVAAAGIAVALVAWLGPGGPAAPLRNAAATSASNHAPGPAGTGGAAPTEVASATSSLDPADDSSPDSDGGADLDDAGTKRVVPQPHRDGSTSTKGKRPRKDLGF
jgi:hypothetical protein